MRAAVLRDPDPSRAAKQRPGDAPDFSRLAVEDVRLDGPGHGEVLVEIAYASLCHSDLSVLTGDRPRPLPMVLGHEASGRVLTLGSGVEHLGVGDHVVCTFVASCGHCTPCRAGRPALCERAQAANTAGRLVAGGSRLTDSDGRPVGHHLGISAFAERVVVDANSLVPVPADIPLRDAALFGCAVTTGAGAVLNALRIGLGESAVVIGCGGVGLAAVLGLRAVGAGPIVAVDVHPGQLELAVRLGADAALLSDATTVQAIHALTAGGAAHVLEASGTAAALDTARAALRRGGQLVLVGLPNPRTTWAVSPAALVADDITIRGSYLGSSVPSRDIPRFIELYRLGRLPVDQLVGETMPLEAVADGMRRLHDGVVGRLVLEVAGG